MTNISLKSFLLGASLVTLVAILAIFRDDVFTRDAKIEILDPKTNQTRIFEGSGVMQVVIQPLQMTTDWPGRYDIHAFRRQVTKGVFKMPSRFYRYVESSNCFEAGCTANFSFEGRDEKIGGSLFCSSVQSSNLARKETNSVLFQCN